MLCLNWLRFTHLAVHLRKRPKYWKHFFYYIGTHIGVYRALHFNFNVNLIYIVHLQQQLQTKFLYTIGKTNYNATINQNVRKIQNIKQNYKILFYSLLGSVSDCIFTVLSETSILQKIFAGWHEQADWQNLELIRPPGILKELSDTHSTLGCWPTQ